MPRCPSSTSISDSVGAVWNCWMHLHAGFIFKLDLADAFSSVDDWRLSEIIANRIQRRLRPQRTPSANEWHDFLKPITFYREGGLIQGSLISPLLLEWFAEVTIDAPIRRLLMPRTFESAVFNRRVYTRFVDDLVISLPSLKDNSWIRRGVRDILSDARFIESGSKTVVLKRASQGTAKITGPRTNITGHYGLSRKQVKAMERMLNTAIHTPLFAEKPCVIDGKLRYLLDVLRGKDRLNALEHRTLLLYRDWLILEGRSPYWPIQVLNKKWKKPRNQKNKKLP